MANRQKESSVYMTNKTVIGPSAQPAALCNERRLLRLLLGQLTPYSSLTHASRFNASEVKPSSLNVNHKAHNHGFHSGTVFIALAM
jgi:hypothetical protein